MNIYLVFYRLDRASDNAPECELEIEHELGQFVRQQVGPGKSWLATERTMDEMFDVLCKKIQDTGCLFIASRDGAQHCIHPESIRSAFEDDVFTERDSVARARELFDKFLNDSTQFFHSSRSAASYSVESPRARAA